jgi:hypothetical protein
MNTPAYVDGYLCKEAFPWGSVLPQPRMPRASTPKSRERKLGRIEGGSGLSSDGWDGRSRQSHLDELSQLRADRDNYYQNTLKVPESMQGENEPWYRTQVQNSYDQRVRDQTQRSDPYKTYGGQTSQAQTKMDAYNRPEAVSYRKQLNDYNRRKSRYKSKLMSQIKAGTLTRDQASAKYKKARQYEKANKYKDAIAWKAKQRNTQTG